MSLFDRTFHPDEANQAFTTGRLLETGMYRYDPGDHHGPTLYYAAAAIQKAAGANNTASPNETLLRCTPLLFAVLTLVLCFAAARKILHKSNFGRNLPPFLLTALVATSPVFVFFATDFIQEMLLACFTMSMLWAATGYAFSLPASDSGPRKIKPGSWALFLGISAGLAFATKETSVLAFAAIFFPALASAVFCRKNSVSCGFPGLGQLPSHLVLAFAGFVLTAVLFYSSFAQNWQGVYSAFVAAPLSYACRATGDAASKGAAYHVHPWWQHLKWLFGGKMAFAAYSAIGISLGLYSLRRDRDQKAIPLPLKAALGAMLGFAMLLAAIYSGIPYKTPWCALQMHVPLLIAAFLGLLAFSKCGTAGRIAFIASSVVLLCENMSISAKMWSAPDSRDIPYNYASASPQAKDMAGLIASLVRTGPAAQAPGRSRPFVAIALPSEDTWPLPFYLRSLNADVGYWTQFGELEALAGLKRNPDIVVVPAEEGHLVQPLFPHLKNTRRFEMRHRVRVRVFW
jgi:uncharacterized protein (TIGR03663 family)